MRMERETVFVDLELGVVMDKATPAFGHQGLLVGEMLVAVPIVYESYAEYCQSIPGGRDVLARDQAEVEAACLDLVYWDETGEEKMIPNYSPDDLAYSRLLRLARTGH